MKAKNYLSIIFASLLTVSCVDTILLPDNKTVDEDFWKSKSDVSLMVNGAYNGMLSEDVIARLIIWGDFRSDELVAEASLSGSIPNALTEISAANIQVTNMYSSWSSIYSVINRCNIVLERAEEVMSIDPSYTEGDYAADRSQMLALRALCYFYLVRNFRDVPYTTVAHMNSSQELNIPQAAPDSVLQCCIDDLTKAETGAINPAGYNDWRRVGYLTRDGIHALLADIYLWRASVKHSAEDYRKCVEYCDMVIESKKNQHVVGAMQVEEKEYPLADGTDMFNLLFVLQNAEESIFELQFNGENNSNSGVGKYYYKYANNNSTQPFLKASYIFGTASASTVFSTNSGGENDYRFWSSIYDVKSTDESFAIRKMTHNQSNIGLASTQQRRNYNARDLDQFRQNYIIYRLSDIMLLKAEALTALAADKDDVQLREAFNLVRYVNARSRKDMSDTLHWNTYSNIDAMERLVLDERLRELCFEGKRWYDLMRYNFRKTEEGKIDYSRTFYQQGLDASSYAKNSSDMMNLMIRKYTSGASSVAAKMPTEPYLYMPIPNSDVEVSPVLHQNPAYSTNEQYEKNY